MAQVLYLRGLMERIGRGTQKIIQSCVDQGLRPPQWDGRETGVTLTLWGPGGAPGGLASLNARRQALLEAMKLDERIRRRNTVSGLRPRYLNARLAETWW